MSEKYPRDLRGFKFGRLLVIERAPAETNKNSYWRCVCDCGNETIVSRVNLRNGNTQSCGCYAKEIAKSPQRIGKIVSKRTKHGGVGTPLYAVWAGIKARVGNPNAANYERYGGRGIRICPEWKNDFQSFQKWSMENGYKKGLSIDRIDNNGDYCPENCRWVDGKTQMRNRCVSKIASYHGLEKTIAEWAEISGLPYNTVWHRFDNNWPESKIFFDAPNKVCFT